MKLNYIEIFNEYMIGNLSIYFFIMTDFVTDNHAKFHVIWVFIIVLTFAQIVNLRYIIGEILYALKLLGVKYILLANSYIEIYKNETENLIE